MSEASPRSDLHRLLVRQAQRAGVDVEHLPPAARVLLQRVSATYRDADEYRDLMTRANDLSSQELTELSARVQAANEGLEEEVQRRTRELLQAKEAADASLRAKSTFLANMSHELRTPLHGMLGFAEIGEQRALAADQQRLAYFFKRIGESGGLLRGLLDDLLDLSKLEAGRMQMQWQSSCLLDCCQRVRDEFDATARARRLAITVRSATSDATATVDPVRFMQVVRNLVANAVKFAPAESTVELTLAGDRQWVEVECSDRGPGIPEPELGAIFDAFVQSSATTTGAGGTGLGLSICREIVTAHGGDIYARNRADGGARFVARLPRNGAATSASQSRALR